ncbi:sensor histidine kinase, partial [Patescibacteria group bacterium]
MNIKERIIDGFNLKKQAEDLGVSIWKSPSFMFIVMGLVNSVSMIALYFFLNEKSSAEFLVITEALTVAAVFILGTFIIRNFEVIAQANKMKSEFVSIASHQLKTPLSKISWGAELLLDKRGEGLTDEQIKIINRIASAGNNMNRLVKDLLDVAKIDQGSLFLSRDQVNIVDLIEEAVVNNEILAGEYGSNIVIKEADNIPMVVADKKRVFVVLDNLISNALKYSEKNGQIEISIEMQNNNISVCIKDNGIGIPEEQQSLVFEKFFRAHNTAKLKTSGTGLGLYISNKVIKQSGGKMWFKSIEKVGSLFCFLLPIKNK